MINLPIHLSQGLCSRANNFSEFRTRCKEYLANNGVNHDKFTTTPFDSFLGYVSEEIIANYLRNKYRGRVCVSKWQDQFDMELVRSIVKTGRNSKEDVDLICSYFYDSFDLYVSTPSMQIFIDLKIDVKTAITQKKPQNNWEFLYPVVQAKKLGKDIAILVYYIVDNKDDPSTLKEIAFVGFLRENEITCCKRINAGEKTKHKTLSQTDNYITYVRDYHSIDELFKEIEIQ